MAEEEQVAMRRVISCFALVLLLGTMAVACGGDDDSGELQGDAASVTARFFAQERDGLKLPEQSLDITTIGVQNSRELDSGDATARFCVEHAYSGRGATGVRKVRVYVAELRDGTWTVEAVKDDGDCEGVE